MRLTEKDKMARYGYKYVAPNRFDNFGEGCNKLGQLEDILEGHKVETLEELDGLLWYVKQIKEIEQKLGVDLLLRHRVERSQGLFVKELNEIFYGCYCNTDGERGVEIIYYTHYGQTMDKHYFRWKDYGKSWALTKEELE